ncbi:MAG TPA: S1-like domain-containing RNA-binding protein [Labilithrix sp.]|nr:S1-like domain-containing RNA-binding protein [Labilithrix sp.]
MCKTAPMSIDELLGRFATLTIERFGSPGAFLAAGPKETLLLIGSEIPEGAKEGDELDVFVYLDSEGRPIATTRVAKLELGEVAFLTVTALTEYGAFVDWGLAKELLVPFAEQTADMRVGARYPIGLYIDDSGRLAGTMRVSEMLSGAKAEWKLDEWVEGEAWRDDAAIGLFVIVERSFVGLVPASEPHGLSRGEAARFRVTNVLQDGRIELSLRGHAHEELETDAQHILQTLLRPNAPRMGDKSSPEDIRAAFGLSKKAFKRAVGRLLKDGSVSIDGSGFVTPRR